MYILQLVLLKQTKMKRIYSLLFLFFIPFIARAQFEGGIRAGMNVSDWKTSDLSYSRPGGSVGLTGEYTWGGRWNLQSGLIFSAKGINGLAAILPEKTTAAAFDLRLYYLEIPVMLRYRIPLAEQIALLPAVGPYFACGVGGTAQMNGMNIPSGSYSENPFQSTGNFRGLDRFDWGLAFAVTARAYRWDITLGYELGLYKNSMGPLTGSDLRNRNLSVTLGYRFCL